MSKPNDPHQTPFWQSEPCPAWCTGSHHDDEHPRDRMHVSAWEGQMTLTLVEPHTGRNRAGDEWCNPSELHVYVVQAVRETAPRVQLSTEVPGHTGLEIDMTVDEARRLRRRLGRAIRMAAKG